MNLAFGFPCPVCGHLESNVLEVIKDERASPQGHRLHCTRCETVYIELPFLEGE